MQERDIIPFTKTTLELCLIFDGFSTFLEFNAPIKQRPAKDFIWIFKMLYWF